MYDRLLKLIEAQGEIRKKRPGTMAGGVGSGEAPPSKPYNPTNTASLTMRSPRTNPDGQTIPPGEAIKSQRMMRGLANLHSGRKKS